MLTKKEMRVVELFARNIFADYTIREMMKKIRTKSYNWTHLTAKKLEKEGILILRKKGSNQLCRLNMRNENTLFHLAAAEESIARASKTIPWKNIMKMLGIIDTSFFTFLVTGSYAKGNQTPQSDLDIVVICSDGFDAEGIMMQLKRAGELMTPEVHPYVFTESQFHDMLASKKANYGKEIFENHIIIAGGEAYFRIIRRAAENGFSY